MQKRASMILALFLVFSLMLSGCGGGGGGGGGGTQKGSIEGWVSSNGTEITIIGGGMVPTGYSALTGATITLSNSAITATTNSDGLFRMDNVPPGDYTLTVTKDGLSTQFPITVKSGQTTTAFTGSLEGYVFFNKDTYTMIIRDSTGAAPTNYQSETGATITLTNRSGTVTTGSWGHFRIDGLPGGTYTLTVAGSTFYPQVKADFTATVKAGQTTTAFSPVVQPGSGSMEGYVHDDSWGVIVDGSAQGSGAPMVSVPVTITGVATVYRSAQKSDNRSKFATTTTTDSNGHFRADNLPPGDYVVTVPKGTDQYSFSAIVQNGRTTNTFITLGNGWHYTLNGYVFYSSATNTMKATSVRIPQPGYTPSPSAKIMKGAFREHPMVIGTTDMSGHFRILDSFNGSIETITVEDTDGHAAQFTADIKYGGVSTISGENNDGSKGGFIEGKAYSNGTTVVIDASGQPAGYGPLGSATVSISGGSTSVPNTTTNSNGHFGFDNIPAGNYTVTVTNSAVTNQFSVTVQNGRVSRTFN